MSAQQQGGFAGAAKKAVHVKWAGKTIALGTFPAAEADEKCARAKALTRAWRSSMRPKPTREWVMVELERLGVRVVSGRLGRKAGEEGEDGDKKNAAAAMPGTIDRTPSLGWGTSELDIMARRNSSLGILNDAGRRGSLGSLGQVVGMEGDPTLPGHRSLVGGGAAAAYEASRHDFTQKGEQQRRSSSLGLGTLGGGLGNIGMSVNPNQHYEMLKLHHMNLLNEIQETTLMMNLYQQQQLQQQQQQLQQQAGDMSDAQLSMVMQNQGSGGMDPVFQMQQQRASLGLGGSQIGGNFGAGGGQQMPTAQQQSAQQSSTDQGSKPENAATTSQGDAAAAPEAVTKEESTAEATQSSDAAPASGDSSENKRETEDKSAEEPAAKRTKVEEEGSKTEETDPKEKK